MKLRAWLVVAATVLVGTTPLTASADGDLGNEKIAAQLTDRLLNQIYPNLLAQDSHAVAAVFWQDGDGIDTRYDGTFVFEQPVLNTNVVEVIQGRTDLENFLNVFFSTFKPCSFDLHEDSVRFSIFAQRRAATMFFTQTAKVVIPGQGGNCNNPLTQITWVMDITRNEVWKKGVWYTLNDHNVIRVSTLPEGRRKAG